ncbi:hypothetical protein TPENAI_10274 [Tenacibaculum litopenaei]|uniref:helix-turn-helix domain-containing protein n=1 Tax=Tenacibaculum litopenaei TaxID=396016 RepID=UPI003894DA23
MLKKSIYKNIINQYYTSQTDSSIFSTPKKSRKISVANAFNATQTLFLYLINGELNLKLNKNKNVSLKKNEAILIPNGNDLLKKENYLSYHNCNALTISISNKTIQSFIKKTDINYTITPSKKEKKRMTFTQNHRLKNLIDSLFLINQNNLKNKEKRFELKIQELLWECLDKDEHYFISNFIDHNDIKSIKIDEVLRNNIHNKVTIEQLARDCNMSLSKFKRIFKAEYNMTPGKWIHNERMKIAYNLLSETDMQVVDIAYQIGFNSPSHFTKSFKKTYGYSPIQKRKKT